ncbi:MAG: tetratricopeptide repeat protein [Bernardetiaceae bacterium]|nr:tetratricopeptide repeat protein [Bernardetiaceae bacterium]
MKNTARIGGIYLLLMLPMLHLTAGGSVRFDSLVQVVITQQSYESYENFIKHVDKHYTLSEIKDFQSSFRSHSKSICYALFALAHKDKQNLSYWKAHTHYQEALDLAQAKKWSFEQTLAHFELSVTYIELNQEDKALTAALDAATLAEKNQYYYFTHRIYYLIARIYYRIDDFENALFYYQKSDKQLKERDIQSQYRHSLLNNLALCYVKLSKYKEAISIYEKAVALAKKHDDQAALFLIYGNMGYAYKQLGNYEIADSLLTVDYKGSLAVESYGSALNALNLLTEIAIENKDYEKAKQLADTAYQIGYKYSLGKSLIQTFKNLEKLALQQQDYKTAHAYLNQYLLLKDSLLANYTRIDKVNKADIAYQIAKETSKIDVLVNKNERNNIMLAVVSILLVVITMFGVLLHKRSRDKESFNMILLQKNEEIQSQNQALESQNNRIAAQTAVLRKHVDKIHKLNHGLEKQVSVRTLELQKTIRKLSETQNELETFMYRASHDLRAPIARLLGFIELIRLQNEDDSQLMYMKLTVDNMDKMLSKLVKIHTLLTSPPEKTSLNIDEIFYQACEQVKRSAININNQNIDIIYESEVKQDVYTDEECLMLVFQCLLENALNFSQSNTTIKVAVQVKEKQIYCKFISKGDPIPDAERANIFKMFVRASERSQGNGLGLYMARKAARLIEGDLLLAEVEPTTFILRIPFQQEPLEVAEAVKRG